MSGTWRGCVRTCRIRGLRRQFPRPGETRIQDLRGSQEQEGNSERNGLQVRYRKGEPCTSTSSGTLRQGHGQGQGLSPRPPVEPPVPHLGVQKYNCTCAQVERPPSGAPSRGQYVLWVTGSTGRCLGLTLITGDLFPSSLLRSRPLVIPSLFFLLAARFAASPPQPPDF